MVIQVPIRFLGYDSVLYIISALIGFLVSYYAYKIWNVTSKKSHLYFYLSFVLLSMGLSVLSAVSVYTYVNYQESGQLNLFDQIVYVDDFGFWIYYGASLLGYILLILAYLPERKMFPIMLPVWFKGFPYFHLSSFFLLSFVIFKGVTNFISKKNMDSFLVMFAFAAIGLFHILLFLSSFSKLVYVIAHISLILGFSSLLLMLVRVNRK